MSNSYEWAREQCKRYTLKFPKDEQEYIGNCCVSALIAYNNLINGGHSGMSFDITRTILDNLLNGIPLVPLEDTPDDWMFVRSSNDEDCYHHKMRHSLSKYVNRETKKARFIDTDRVVCKDHARTLSGEVNIPGYYSGLICDLVHEICPITFPYTPTKSRYVALVEELLTDPKNGDFDSVALRAIVTPKGHSIIIDKFFKEENHSWTRISLEEWNERVKMDQDRHDREKNMLSYGKDVTSIEET